MGRRLWLETLATNVLINCPSLVRGWRVLVLRNRVYIKTRLFFSAVAGPVVLFPFIVFAVRRDFWATEAPAA